MLTFRIVFGVGISDSDCFDSVWHSQFIGSQTFELEKRPYHRNSDDFNRYNDFIAFYDA